jgi:hypothetical protein
MGRIAAAYFKGAFCGGMLLLLVLNLELRYGCRSPACCELALFSVLACLFLVCLIVP